MPGAATSISVQSTHPAGSLVGPDIPWVVSADGKIFRRSNNAWRPIPGCAKDIGVGDNGSTWVLGCKSGGPGGYQIFSWNGSGWNLVPGAATRIAVSPEGTPWVVSADGKIFKRSNNAWQQISGCAKDIAVGANNDAWVLGCASGGSGGYQIFSWNGSGWTLMPGAATKIAVWQQGHPWAVAANGGIFRWATQPPP